MDRQKAIDVIEASYPADARQLQLADTGRRLLAQAQREAENWRQLPTAVLQRYAQLCLCEYRRRENIAIRNAQSRI